MMKQRDKEHEEGKKRRKEEGREGVKEGERKKEKEKNQFEFRCMPDFSEDQTFVCQQFIIFEAKAVGINANS